MAAGTPEKEDVLHLVSARYTCGDLGELCAQAFDARDFTARDRCWRCRIPFGFEWLWTESGQPTQPKVMSVTLRGYGVNQSKGNLVSRGKARNAECCAEGLL